MAVDKSMNMYIVNSIIHGLILLNSTNEVVEINMKWFVLFSIFYYLLPGVLYYFYMFCGQPKDGEKWYVYVFFSGGIRPRIGLAMVLALLTMYALKITP